MSVDRNVTQAKLAKLSAGTLQHTPSQSYSVGDRIEERAAEHPRRPFLYFEERTLTSVTANTRSDGEELLAVAAEIPLRPRITAFPLEQANQALEQLERDGIRGSGVLTVGA